MECLNVVTTNVLTLIRLVGLNLVAFHFFLIKTIFYRFVMVGPIVMTDVMKQIVQQLVMKLVYPVIMATNTKEEWK